MAQLYEDVKKQGVQIDELQKTTANHSIRIETLETQAAAIPPPTAPPPAKIKVELPPDIATNDEVERRMQKVFKENASNFKAKVEFSGFSQGLAEAITKAIRDPLGESVKKEIRNGIGDAFSDSLGKLNDTVSEIRYRINRVMDGQWWLATPKWVFWIALVLLLAASGFGYGFFHLLEQNEKLTQVEWLYRRERTLYRTDAEEKLLLNHEKEFFMGSPHEQDSIKNIIRYLEKANGSDKTYLYYYPSER